MKHLIRHCLFCGRRNDLAGRFLRPFCSLDCLEANAALTEGWDSPDDEIAAAQLHKEHANA